MNNNEIMKMHFENHSKSLKALDELIMILDKELLKGEIHNTQLGYLSLFFLTRFHKSLLAFRTLVVNGFEEDARIILRTLVEILITIIYISRKPDERTQQFIDYMYVAQFRLLETIDRHYKDNKVEDNKREQIVNDYQKVKAKFKRKDRWTSKTLKSMAEEIGEDALYWYELIYNVDSSYVHSDINSSKGFMNEGEGEYGIFVKTGPQMFEATDIVSKACELTHFMLLTVGEYLKLNKNEIKNKWMGIKSLIIEEFELKKK